MRDVRPKAGFCRGISTLYAKRASLRPSDVPARMQTPYRFPSSGWRGLADASNLVRVHQEALTACREAAAKAKKEQRCTITVPAE